MINSQESARLAAQTDPEEEQIQQFNIPYSDYYIKISEDKTEIKSSCKCWSCELVKDFSIEYYKNTTILRDNDRLVHIPKVVD